jgi:glycosyltransferase involved in cell wall biosynthesis
LAIGPRGCSRGVNVIGLSIPRYRGDSKIAYLGSYLRFFAQASKCATSLSRSQRYDVVIICTMPDAAVLCSLGPRLYGAKVVLDVHDTMPELYRDKFRGIFGALGSRLLMAEERASAWFADRVMAVHEPHRKRLAQAGVPPRKLSVVMNLPDRRLFRGPRIPHRALPATATVNGKATQIGGSSRYQVEPAADNAEVFRLVCHGTITMRLGLDLAVLAIGLLRDKLPCLHLQVIGEGDFLRSIRVLTERLGLQARVTFTPSMAVEQLPSALEKASVGLVPNRASRATHLMLPAKLLEYATLGIPVIAARLSTVEYYFPSGAVRYFEPGDVEGLAAAIEELSRSPETRQRLRRKAAEVAANLNWEHQRSRLFETVDSLLQAKTTSTEQRGEFQLGN